MKRWLLTTTLLSTLVVPGTAQADPISMAIASTASAAITAGGISALTFTGLGLSLTGWGAAFAQFAVRAALGYALNALAPKQNVAGRGYSVNSLGSALPHAIIYGETVVGGAIFYQTTTGSSNRYLHRCIAFAGHEIDSFQTFYLDDKELTLDSNGDVTAPSEYVGHCRIKTHLGTDTQAADADLVSEVTEWTTAHQAKGVAYVYVRYDHDEAFPNGAPTLTAKVRGKKVYDPRTTTTAWSNNPALCLRDYLVSNYGLSETTTEINDDEFTAAADICDQTVSSAKRYTCNGAFTLDGTPQAIVSGILSSMGGMFWYAQGQWGCKAASYVAPTLSFDEDDLRGNFNIATKNSRRDNFNKVNGVFRGAETDWQESEFEPITSATYLAEDGGIESSIDMQLLFTDTEVMARRIADISLERNRRQVTLSAAFGLRALQVGIGDTIMINNTRAGFSSKVFEVNDWRFAMSEDMDLQVNLLLREIDSAVFA